jgi:outer membrane immunogenic protein
MGGAMLRQLLGVVGVSSFLVAAPLSVAGAADMNMPLKAPLAPPPPAYTWTGCYISGGGGYALWNRDLYTQNTVTGVATVTSTDGGRGWMGVFGGGCDYQFSLGSLGNWVIGAFGDYDIMDIEGTNEPQGLALSGSEKESNAWFVGGRLGYLVTPSLMTYFDGGYTQTRFDQVNFATIFSTPSVTSLPAQTYSGWFLGGGTEYALNFSWLPIHGLFWRNEYRYASYDSATNPIINTATGAATVFSETSRPYVQTITSSLVWRFNWMGR